MYCPNDIRELEDENPIENGDKYMVQSNMTTLEKEGEQNEINNQAAFEVDEQTGEAGTAGTDPGTDAQAKTILVDAFDRIVSRETRRIQDAVKKYDGDFPGLVKFLDKFCADHEKYMAKTPRWIGLPNS